MPAAVLFRLLIAIPHLIWLTLWALAAEPAVFAAWLAALFTGRMHEWMQDTSTWLLRYEVQTAAYALPLTQRYPSLSGSPTP